MELQSLCIASSATIKESLQRLDSAAQQILFVVEGKQLLATLTDGDVRRYLLAGGNLADNVMAAANQNPKTAQTIKQAHRMLETHRLHSIPLVDRDDIILAVVFEHQTVSDISKGLDIPVVIMAGGKGTRLEPFTKVLPKPLIPVGDTPIIEHIMEEFEQYGCNRFHLIVNHKKQLIKAYFADGNRSSQVVYYDEDKPLGTGGGLFMLKGKIKETFFLTNCDILIKADYLELLRFHRENKNVITMVCAHKNVTIPYGVVEIGEGNVITGIREKPNFSFLTNTGLYLVEPDILNDIEDNENIGFPDIIARQQIKGRKTAVFAVAEDDWMDMGQLTELEEMRERLEARK